MINFYDTSALLNIEVPFPGTSYVSPIVFKELERIKTSCEKNEHVKYAARQLVNGLLVSEDYTYSVYPQDKIDKLLKKYNFLTDIDDHRLICEALLVEEDSKEKIMFITSDGAQYLFARMFPQLNAMYYGVAEEDGEEEEFYSGWGKYYPTESQMTSIYSSPEFNILGSKRHEYIEIFEDEKLKDLRKWNGKEYTNLKYSEFKTALGEKISPRNTEQKMLFDLLQDRSIPIKLCLGRFGSGKSFLMLAHALQLVQKGEFDRIVFVRNNIEVKDAGKLGYLPGTQDEKILPYLMPIADHIGEIELERYLDEGIIEPIPLGFIRGRDIRNAIVFCDEVENMTKQHIQLLIGRISTGSELWLAGDLKQTDSITFEKNSGIKTLVQRLAGDELFGMVKLMKSERSATAAKADLLD